MPSDWMSSCNWVSLVSCWIVNTCRHETTVTISLIASHTVVTWCTINFGHTFIRPGDLICLNQWLQVCNHGLDIWIAYILSSNNVVHSDSGLEFETDLRVAVRSQVLYTTWSSCCRLAGLLNVSVCPFWLITLALLWHQASYDYLRIKDPKLRSVCSTSTVGTMATDNECEAAAEKSFSCIATKAGREYKISVFVSSNGKRSQNKLCQALAHYGLVDEDDIVEGCDFLLKEEAEDWNLNELWPAGKGPVRVTIQRKPWLPKLKNSKDSHSSGKGSVPPA